MSEPHQVRIGDQQREEAIHALNDHFASGRLEIGEYEERIGYASAAQTAQELSALFRDLPQPRPEFAAPSYPAPTAQYPNPTAQYPGPTAQYPGPDTGYPSPATGFPPPNAGYPPPPPMPGYGTPGPPPPGYADPTQSYAYGYPPGYHPNAPYGVDPISGLPLSDKSRVAAGVLQLVLPFGIGRFYMGDTAIGVAQLLTCGGCGIWSLVDGIILLVNGGTDSQGRKLRD